MINLIPPHARRKVTQEYWTRTVTVWLYLLGIAFVCTAILFVPAYVLVKSQLAVYGEAYQTASADNEQFTVSKTAITTANETALLLATDNVTDFSVFMDAIQLSASANIIVTTVTMDRVGTDIKPIAVSGVAANRISLANFRDALEAHEYFVTANLPLSNLAKDADITFTITVTPAKDI